MKRLCCIFLLFYICICNIFASINVKSENKIITSKSVSLFGTFNFNAGISSLFANNKTTLFGFSGDLSGAISLNLNENFFLGVGIDYNFGKYADIRSSTSSELYNLHVNTFSLLAEVGHKGYRNRKGNLIGICILPGYNISLNGFDIGVAIEVMGKYVAFDAIRVMYTISPQHQLSRLSFTVNALGLLGLF